MKSARFAMASVLLACLGGAAGCSDAGPSAVAAESGPRRWNAATSETSFLKDADPGAVALGIVLKGLKEPVAAFIGEHTTSLLIDLVFGPQTPDYTEQLDAIESKVDNLETLSQAANDRLTALEAQLRVTKSELENAGFTSTLSAPTTHLESLFSGNASGGADGCDPSKAVSSSLCWYFAPDRSAVMKRLAAPDFVAAVDPAQVLGELAQIHGAICPQDGSATGLLDNYADLVVGRLDPTSGDIARPIDAIESRFIALVRTQIHGLQVLAAYYQIVAQLQSDPEKKAIALSNLSGALGAYESNFAREADAYLAATARYVAVAAGNPAYLTPDATTGALVVDAPLLARLARAPAVADAVRSIGAQLSSSAHATTTRAVAAAVAAAAPAVAVTAVAAPVAAPDVVHAVFLARQTDGAFAHLTVTATAADDPARTATVEVVAQPASSGKAYAYAGRGAGRELHTQNGRYAVFVPAASGSGTALALSDGWWVHEVNLLLPAGTSSTKGNVQLLVTTTDGVGGATFSKTLTVAPAFAASAGEPTVYVVADDYRMNGPTSRVDLFPWSAPTPAVNNACECQDYDETHNWDGCKVGGPTLASGSAAATGTTADVSIVTGRYTMNTGCNVQQTLAVTSAFRDQATNAVVFAAVRQVRSADTASWLSTGIFAADKKVSLTCANDLYTFRDWRNAFLATNAITLGSTALTNASWTTMFTPEMKTSCDPDYVNDTGWWTGRDTLTSVSTDALASRTGATWDSGVQVLTSAPQTFAPGSSSTLSVNAGFQLPFGLSHVKVQTRLASFGVYVP